MVKLLKVRRAIAISIVFMIIIGCCPNFALAKSDDTFEATPNDPQAQEEIVANEKLLEEVEELQENAYISTDRITELAGVQAQMPPSIVSENFDKSEIRNTPQGVGTITIKVVIRVLKKYKTKIIKTVKSVNKSWGEKLEKNYPKLLSYLDTLKGSVEAVLVKALIKIGLSESSAEIVADIIITLVSWLI